MKGFLDYCREMQTYADVAHAIMDIRLFNGWTQQELAMRSGVPLSRIRSYENMDRLPDLDTLNRLAKTGGYLVRISLEQMDPNEVKTPKGALDN